MAHQISGLIVWHLTRRRWGGRPWSQRLVVSSEPSSSWLYLLLRRSSPPLRWSWPPQQVVEDGWLVVLIRLRHHSVWTPIPYRDTILSSNSTCPLAAMICRVPSLIMRPTLKCLILPSPPSTPPLVPLILSFPPSSQILAAAQQHAKYVARWVIHPAIHVTALFGSRVIIRIGLYYTPPHLILLENNPWDISYHPMALYTTTVQQ